MFIRVEKSSAVPISRQIADQMRALCLAGSLPPGSRLPSVRQLARDLAVNQNTVLRVYERLAAENLLESRHGDGTFSTTSPPAWRLDEQREQFVGELGQVVHRGRMLGVEPRSMRATLDAALDATIASPLAAPGDAAPEDKTPPASSDDAKEASP